MCELYRKLEAAAPKYAPGKRQLSSKQKAELQGAIKNETFAVPESFFAESTYDELLEEELKAQYFG